jgi:isopenicillin N synthase-like dioxygenase
MTANAQHPDPGRTLEPSGATVAVPVVDLAALEGADAAAVAARARLLEIARNPGSFYLTGHGLPIEVGDALFAAARTFFDLPEPRKLEIENIHSPQFRGYTKVGGELTAGKVDRREQIDIGPERAAALVDAGQPAWTRLIGPNLWPQDVPELRVRALAWYDELSLIGRRLLRALSLALGQPETAFDGVFAAGSDSLLKIVRYPGREDDAEDQGVGPHTDSGLLTFVWQEQGTSGLQTLVGADWVDVPVLPGSFAVNIGELLEVATDGVLHANVHQVISPAADADRRSICFFLNPELSAPVPTLRYQGALRELADGPRSVAANPFHASYGENALKSRLRSHPNVAQLHHADLLAGTN